MSSTNFKLLNGSVSFGFEGEVYTIQAAVSIAHSDSVMQNALVTDISKNDGIVYQTGLSAPETTTITVRHQENALRKVLTDMWKKATKGDWAFNSNDGSTITYKSAVIVNQPKQNAINEDATQFDIPINLQCSQIIEELIDN